MSYLPVSLMNRLNQTKSAVFKLWMLNPKDPLFRLFRDHNSCHCVKHHPINRYSVITFYIFWSFGTIVNHFIFTGSLFCVFVIENLFPEI